MNNQMNIFIKLLCPRKFQQTDRVQPTAHVQIQHEGPLQGCIKLQLTMDYHFKFQQTDRVQPTAPAQIQQEDLLQVTNGG